MDNESTTKRIMYSDRACFFTRLKELSQTEPAYADIKFKPVPWDHKKYGDGPPTDSFLLKYPNDYDLSFDKMGCEKLAAFCIEHAVSSRCHPLISSYKSTCTTSLNPSFSVKFCQENCTHLPEPLDVYWDDTLAKCRLVNILKKVFCIKPHSNNNVPPLNWYQNENACKMSEEYCTYFGFSFDDEKKECYNPKVQEFFEKFVFGQTLVRGILHPTMTLSHIGVDDESVRKNYFKCLPIQSQSQSQSQSQALVQENVQKPKPQKVSGGYFEIGVDVAKDVAITSLPVVSLSVANSSIHYLANFTKNLSPHLVKSVVLLEANNIFREQLLFNAMKFVSKLNVAVTNWEFFLVTVLGSLLDLTDTLTLNNSMTSVQFIDLINNMDKTFSDNVKSDIVTPEVLIDFQFVKLKSQNRMKEAFDLKYGGVHRLVEVFKDYCGETITLMPDAHVAEYKIPIPESASLMVEQNTWPISGSPVIIGSLIITSLVALFVVFSRNPYILICLIIFVMIFILYLKQTTKWK